MGIACAGLFLTVLFIMLIGFFSMANVLISYDDRNST